MLSFLYVYVLSYDWAITSIYRFCSYSSFSLFLGQMFFPFYRNHILSCFFSFSWRQAFIELKHVNIFVHVFLTLPQMSQKYTQSNNNRKKIQKERKHEKKMNWTDKYTLYPLNICACLCACLIEGNGTS